MTNTEILTKAIELAVKRGWRHEVISQYPLKTSAEYFSDQDYRTVVYRHDFAKALWQHNNPDHWDLRGIVSGRKGNGSAEILGSMQNEDFVPAWQWHLMQMVIADDPIKYLGDNI